ncbi:hypothetical protein HG531_011849 [Fusarium graminearum]|nr:hypothetical protein HG531_011849 [Fusarium graminearum]
MTSVQRLLLVVNLLLLDKEKALTLDFDIVVLLLCGSLTQTATAANTALRGVSVIVVTRVLVTLIGGSGSSIGNELNSNEITLKRTVSVLATANKDIGVKEAILSGNVSIATVLLVNTEDTRNELTITQESRKRGLGKIRGEKGLALLLLLLATELTSVLVVLEASNSRDGLVHGSTRSVTRLEALVLTSVAALILSLGAPVSFEVAGSGTSVAASATLELVALSVQAAATTASTAIDSHTLAAAMTSTPSTSRSLSDGNIEGRLSSGLVLIIGGGRGRE